MANNYLITYDLNKQGQNYTNLIAAIKTFSRWAHVQDSVWYIKSPMEAASVRDFLSQHIDSNDSLFVAKMSSAAWKGLSDNVSLHIKENWSR